MLKRVMKRAVQLAKTFEGDWQARMSEALKISWKLEKGERVFKVIKQKAKEWSNYGHHRIYIDGKMVVYVDNWGVARDKEFFFSGYYDVKNKKVVMKGGKASFQKEVLKALSEIAKNYKPAEKENGRRNDSIRLIRAQFPGYCAETGVRFDAGAYIFYCEVAGGYVLADNA